jgi:hypothetical protein
MRIRAVLTRRITPLAALAVALVAGPLAMPASAQPGDSPGRNHNNLTAFLSGAQEVPTGTGDPDGSGVALFDIKPQQGKICYVIWVKNVDGDITGAHIHLGRPGHEGPHVVDLAPPIHGASVGCNWIGRRLAYQLWFRSTRFYVNVHSTKYTDGAVRGQLFRSH